LQGGQVTPKADKLDIASPELLLSCIKLYSDEICTHEAPEYDRSFFFVLKQEKGDYEIYNI